MKNGGSGASSSVKMRVSGTAKYKICLIAKNAPERKFRAENAGLLLGSTYLICICIWKCPPPPGFLCKYIYLCSTLLSEHVLFSIFFLQNALDCHFDFMRKAIKPRKKLRNYYNLNSILKTSKLKAHKVNLIKTTLDNSH